MRSYFIVQLQPVLLANVSYASRAVPGRHYIYGHNIEINLGICEMLRVIKTHVKVSKPVGTLYLNLSELHDRT